MGRIPERPYHACNISERRPFQSPVTQCPCKFPFKINDKEVISRIKDLPQMIVSVDSYLHCRNLLLKNTSESIHNFFFTIQHLVFQSFFPKGLSFQDIRRLLILEKAQVYPETHSRKERMERSVFPEVHFFWQGFCQSIVLTNQVCTSMHLPHLV